MAGKEGRKYNLRRTQPGLKRRSERARSYFYIDQDLYRIIRSDRANDLIRAWSYTDEKIVNFVMSDVKRMAEQAFNTAEVAVFLNRSKENILKHLKEGAINPPVRIGTQDNGSKQYEFGVYKWSESDVRALHEHYLSLGSGRPRKDGMIFSAVRMPSRLELTAMMKQHKMYYVQDEHGNFVPIFDQPDWT